MKEQIDKLAALLDIAKYEEKRAKQKRIEAEEALAKLLGEPEDGSETHRGNQYKVVVKREVRYSLDKDEWEKVKDSVERDWWPVRTKIELDKKKVKLLKEKAQDVYRRLSSAFIAKYAKTAITIKKEVENV